MNKKCDLILLLSGGMDSTILLRMALGMGFTPYCLLFDYGQKHIQELEMAKAQCDKYELDYSIIPIDLNVHSKLTDGSAKYSNVSPWHVPSRNLIFLSFATSLAESEGINLIWYGANYEDRVNLFPDCYQEWVYAMNNLLTKNGSRVIVVEAPLLGMGKETIKKLAVVYNINENEIFSGYGE